MSQVAFMGNLDQFMQPQQLSTLNMAVNMLKEIDPVLQRCSNLRVLDLSINHIALIKNLDACQNLVELNLSKNQIAVIQGLESLRSLKVLDLSMNRIMRIQNLHNQGQLERLALYGNQIEYLEGLDSMRQLKELLINRNKLRSLNYLAMANFESLTRLNASHNQLPEEELDNIARVVLSLHNLKHLDIFGNPVAACPGYKFRLTENSTIEKLDGLDVKGVIKDRLDSLRRDWQINKLIEETSEEAKRWVEAEREIKAAALSILAKKQERITQEFDAYKRQVDDDFVNFISHISDLKTQRDKGINYKITFDDLQTWKYNIQYQENHRLQLLEDQLRRMEEKRKEAVDEAVTTTNFLDKLYEISMDKPDVWNIMKKQEYQSTRLDQGRTSSQQQFMQTPTKQHPSQQSMDQLMQSGMRTMGGRMRQDFNDELEQARSDFEDQNKLEQAAEQRSKYNSQFLGGESVNRSMGSQIKATTPQKYENDFVTPQANQSVRGSGFLDQFKSDKGQNQSLRSSKGNPIPIGGGQQYTNAVLQQSSKDGIMVKEGENPQNKNSKACVIF